MRIAPVLLAALALSFASCKETPTPAGGSIGALPTGAQSPAAEEAAPEVSERLTLAREILRETLNATVEDRSRFEDAPLYQLTLDLDYQLFTYEATSTLSLVNTEGEPLHELNFLVYPNSPEVAAPGAPNIAIDGVKVDGTIVRGQLTGARLRVPLPKPLAAGAETRVEIDFRGNIHRLPPGSTDVTRLALQQLLELLVGAQEHPGGYGVFAVGEDIVSLGLWYPVLMTYEDGRWDVVATAPHGDVSHFDVSNYELVVEAPAHVTVVTTGTEVLRTEEGGVATTRHLAGAVRELAVQMSHRFESASAFVDSVKVTSWYLRSDSTTGRQVLEHGREALKVFNDLFGPYPYTELDLVEAPLIGGAGGVEFPGLVTIGKMFYTPDRIPEDDPFAQALASSRYLRDTLEFVVAHEVAHEWWNAVVGSNSREHAFLDEALANHSAILYFERRHGPEAAEMQTDLQLRVPYQVARLAGAQDRPVDTPSGEFASMMEYAAVVYGKGALFFAEARRRMGGHAHLAFLKEHYRRHRFGFATPESMLDALTRASPNPDDVRTLANRWLNGRHGDEDVGRLRIAQLARYVLGDEAVRGDLGRMLHLLDHQGAGELAKVVRSLLSDDGSLREDVDWRQIAGLAANLLGAEEEAGPLGEVVEMLTKNPDLLNQGSLRGVLKEAAKVALGADEQTSALIDMADLLLQMLEE